jgi:hypothetical protein
VPVLIQQTKRVKILSACQAICSTATLLLVAVQGDDYGLLGQNALLWMSSCFCSAFGWHGAKHKLKHSVIVYVVCSIWVFSAYVVQLYSSSKTDRVGELMCEEYNKDHAAVDNATLIDCAGTSIATTEYGTPGAQILMSKTLLWGVNSFVVVSGIFQGLLLAHCMDETGQGVNRHEKKIKKEQMKEERPKKKAAHKLLPKNRCGCRRRSVPKLHPYLGEVGAPPPTPVDSGEYSQRTNLQTSTEGAAAEGVLSATLSELKHSLAHAAARVTLICVAQFFIASGTLSMNMYVDIEEQDGGRAASGMSMLRSIIAPLTAFLVPLIGIVGAVQRSRDMLVVFLVLQLMGLSTVTTFVFTTISVSSPGSMMCTVMRLEGRDACDGIAALGPYRCALIGFLGLTMITAAVSSFHLTEVIPGKEIMRIAQSRAAQDLAGLQDKKKKKKR